MVKFTDLHTKRRHKVRFTFIKFNEYGAEKEEKTCAIVWRQICGTFFDTIHKWHFSCVYPRASYTQTEPVDNLRIICLLEPYELNVVLIAEINLQIRSSLKWQTRLRIATTGRIKTLHNIKGSSKKNSIML